MKKTLTWIALAVLSFLALFWLAKSWILALAIMVMIGLHEMGHLAFAKFFKLQTGGFYFLPFLGGVSFTKESAAKRWQDFWVWFGGPFVGAILVVILSGIFFAFGKGWNVYYQATILFIIYIWSLINLFNMLPIFPLDGGGMLWSIAKSFWKGYSPWGAFVVNATTVGLFCYLTKSIIWTLILAYFGTRSVFQRHNFEMDFSKEPMGAWCVAGATLSYVLLGLFFMVGVVGSVMAMNYFGFAK